MNKHFVFYSIFFSILLGFLTGFDSFSVIAFVFFVMVFSMLMIAARYAYGILAKIGGIFYARCLQKRLRNLKEAKHILSEF